MTTAEMEAVYTSRMAKQGGPGRAIYDDIFAAAKGRCPLCAHRTVTTLDHHLPKAHYPVLAVVPVNLVPACSDCNKAKLASEFNSRFFDGSASGIRRSRIGDCA